MTAPKPSIQPTSKHKKHLLGWGTVFLVYSLLGFLAAPHLVAKLAKDYVAKTLHLELAIKHIEINPLSLAVKIEDLTIKQPQGEVLVSLKHLYANSSLIFSIRHQRAYLEELDIIQPYINAKINQTGQLNLLQLVPPDDNQEASRLEWQVAVLGIHKAKIDIADYSQQQPFVGQFNDLSVALFNISSLASNEGRYQLAAQTTQGESFSWQGSIGLNPLRSEGNLAITKLHLKPLADYALNKNLPIRLNQAFLDIQGHYQLQLINEQPQFNIHQTDVKVYDVLAQSQTSRPVNVQLQQLLFKGINVNWPNPQVAINHTELKQLSVQSAQQKMLNVDDVTLANINWQQAKDQFAIQQIAVQNVLVNGQKNTLLTLPNLLIEGFTAKPQIQSFNTGKVILNGGHTHISLLKNGHINLQDELNLFLANLLPAKTPSSHQTTTKTQVSLGEIELHDFVIDAQDQQQQPVFKQTITLKKLTVYPELDLAKPHQLEGNIHLSTGGEIQLKGLLDESPLMVNTQLKVQDLALVPFASYINQLALLKLESGTVNVDGRLQFNQSPKMQARFDGDIGVNRFAVNDLKQNQRFLAWQNLVAKNLQWQLEPMQIHVKEVIAVQPFTRIVIAPDRSINIDGIVPATAQSSSSKNQTTPINIAKIRVEDGSMLFADLSLNPQFATGIQSLSGQINHVSTQANQLAEILLNGRVDQYGTALIKGQINLFKPDQNTNIGLKFDNVELTTLTPYSAKFAGYRIDKGKLSLDLNYQVANRQLVASNKVVLNQLTLGERVDSPDATNLPLRLAIAILKDSNGVIDLNIPITGSLDDPQFKVGPIIWQAVVNVVTKVATAPFRFLASLVNGQDDIDSIPFVLAQSQLNTQAISNLQKVADIMQKKKDLQIEVRAGFNQQETDALQENKFKQFLAINYPNQAITVSLLERLYIAQFGKDALAQAKVLALKPAEQGQNLTNQTTAYQQALTVQLTKAQSVADGDLRQLALERAKNIRNQLVEKFNIEAGRVFILEPSTQEIDKNQQIMTKLTLKQN